MSAVPYQVGAGRKGARTECQKLRLGICLHWMEGRKEGQSLYVLPFAVLAFSAQSNVILCFE
jgi:hypothetical protein